LKIDSSIITASIPPGLVEVPLLHVVPELRGSESPIQ